MEPQTPQPSPELSGCIEACLDCGRACTECADAGLAEESRADLLDCIKLCADVSDICNATGRLLTRRGDLEPQLVQDALRLCASACSVCADECARHGQLEQCRSCEEACRACETACRQALETLAP